MASSSASPSSQRQAKSLLSTPSHLTAHFSAPLASRQYARQYAPLYDFRLRKLRKTRLIPKAKAKWEDGVDAISYTPRILDVQTGRVTYIIGIIYAEMRLKPDVLQDLTREQYLPPLPPVASYTDPTSDTIYLEDESGRLCLVGPLLTSPQYRGAFVTGTIAAFLGTELENGQFHVQDVCWPGLPAPKSSRTQGSSSSGTSSSKKVKLEEGVADDGEESDAVSRPDDEYLVLLSGLDVGGSQTHLAFDDSGNADLGYAQAELRLSLLAEWIAGEIGDESIRAKASQIAGVVVAGNLMAMQKADGTLINAPDGGAPSTGGEGSTSGSKGSTTTASKLSKYATAQANASLGPSPPSALLSHLLQLSASLPLVLMPGSSDPASAAMPQQPVHRAVLRGAEKWAGSVDANDAADSKVKKDVDSKSVDKKSAPAAGGLHLYTNPAWIQFSDDESASSSSVKLLASSGQNLDDILKYIPAADRSESSPTAAPAGSKETQEGEDSTMDVDDDAGEVNTRTTRRDDRLTAALRLLSYGHVAPTCPDTLWCFPFTDRDPFIIDEVPDVLVVGNQPSYNTGLWSSSSSSEVDDVGGDVDASTASSKQRQNSSAESDSSQQTKVRVVLLPRFSQTGEVALLNMRTKAVEKYTIGWEV